MLACYRCQSLVNVFYCFQSVINAPVLDDDFIGLTVSDGTLGLPIGWIFDPIRGNSLYVKSDFSSKQALPQPGLIFNNYQQLPALHRLAIAAYVSPREYSLTLPVHL